VHDQGSGIEHAASDHATQQSKYSVTITCATQRNAYDVAISNAAIVISRENRSMGFELVDAEGFIGSSWSIVL
jgi:hypothetical protein